MVAFGETSISACNDSHSSQATATLGNTPNLNIGSYTKRKPYIGSQTGTTILVPRPKLSIASSDREFYISSADWKSYLASYACLCTSQARFCKWNFQAAICFKPAFSSCGALRFDRRKLRNIIFLAWFRTTWFLLTTHLDSYTSAISGTFWFYCIVSASLLNLC